MQDNLLFSVIMPTYNVADYLSKSLGSLYSQTFKNFEIVLINDCSTDLSLQVAEDIKKKNDAEGQIVFRIFSNNMNSGVSASRNHGLKKANGKYIIFLDPDDWISNTYLEEMATIILKNNVDGIFNSSYWEIQEALPDSTKVIDPPHDVEGVIHSEDFGKLLFDPLVVNCWLYIFRKDYILNFKFIESSFIHEDDFLTPRLLLNCDSIYISKTPQYHYLLRKGSLMHTKGVQLPTYIKELNQLYTDLKLCKHPIDDIYFFKRFYASVSSRFYGLIFRANNDEESIKIFQRWSHDLDLKMILRSISKGSWNMGSKFLLFKFFPNQFRSLYKKFLDKSKISLDQLQ